MTYIIADNIVSPLASGTQGNLQAVLEGRSALRSYDHRFPQVEPFCAALFEGLEPADGLSRFERLCVDAVGGVAEQAGKALLSSERTVFVVSSTKGNIGMLDGLTDIGLSLSAGRIAKCFSNPNTPVVVSNACISGVCALITAKRLLEAGEYDYVVVVGCDVISPFIVSGFQSFKALSPQPCRPFDKDRCGLNLGEAAACMVLSADEGEKDHALGAIVAGAVHNDANHISGPSRTGEGSYLCLRDVAPDDSNFLAFVNAHGTATAYNDEMESIAIERAGLQHVPVNALKGCFGHTLGAAGILETVLSLHALRDGLILPTKGYAECGTSRRMDISSELRTTDKTEFIKLLSGFGGCNAAIRVALLPANEQATGGGDTGLTTVAEVHVTPVGVTLNGKSIELTEHGEGLLTELYKTRVGDYPKFFKMDTLTRLGFVATELLLQSVSEERFVPRDDRAVLFANRSASLKNDTDYLLTIAPDNYYPSPALFVYTLPNIVTGEVAIRNRYYGETSFFVLENELQMERLIPLAFRQKGTKSVLAGWTECRSKDSFEAHIRLITI